MIPLARELKQYGSDFDPGQFNDLLQELHRAIFPVWNIERLICERGENLAYCDAVRKGVGANLPDEMILRRLLNIRKKEGCDGQRGPRTRKAKRRRRRHVA